MYCKHIDSKCSFESCTHEKKRSLKNTIIAKCECMRVGINDETLDVLDCEHLAILSERIDSIIKMGAKNDI